jgi:hypothetical protein
MGKRTIAVAATPVIIVKACAYAAYAIDQVLVVKHEIPGHQVQRLRDRTTALQPQFISMLTLINALWAPAR